MGREKEIKEQERERETGKDGEQKIDR